MLILNARVCPLNKSEIVKVTYINMLSFVEMIVLNIVYNKKNQMLLLNIALI